MVIFKKNLWLISLRFFIKVNINKYENIEWICFKLIIWIGYENDNVDVVENIFLMNFVLL